VWFLASKSKFDFRIVTGPTASAEGQTPKNPRNITGPAYGCFEIQVPSRNPSAGSNGESKRSKMKNRKPGKARDNKINL